MSYSANMLALSLSLSMHKRNFLRSCQSRHEVGNKMYLPHACKLGLIRSHSQPDTLQSCYTMTQRNRNELHEHYFTVVVSVRGRVYKRLYYQTHILKSVIISCEYSTAISISKTEDFFSVAQTLFQQNVQLMILQLSKSVPHLCWF